MEAYKTRKIPPKKFTSKLKPIPRSFLLDFHIDEVREKRHHELLKRAAKINQNKISKLKAPPDFLDLLPIPKLKMIATMQQYAGKAPIPTMTKKTESKILRWVQPHFKKKYSNYIKEYMNDLRTEYDEVVKEFSLHKMLTYNDDYPMKNPKFRFKFLGRTDNYGQFKRNREKIKQKLFITYPFIRCILNYSQTDFPEILNDYSSYNFDSKGNSVYLTPNEFKARVAEDLLNKTLFLKNAWYPKIINVFKKNLRKYRLTPNVWYRIFDCAHGLINQQLNIVKIRTYQHIFDILLDRARTPRFQLQTECNGKDIDLCPQYSEINMLFTKIFEDISNVGSKLIPLDQIIKIGNEMPAAKSEYIPITIGDSFMKEMHEELDRSLLQAYTPILVYLTEFRCKYVDLYADETQIQIEEFVSVPRDITVYLDKIKVFQDFISKLRSQPVNEYFIIAIVNQAKAIAGLRCIATEFIERITSKIVAEHTLECKNICKFFEDVESKSKEVPTTTEQLLEGGEFMTQVKTVHMKEMQLRIEENIRVNGLLVDLTELSQDHFDLQQRTINLFNNMYNVFEENAAFFEAYKIQFEEHLQTVTRRMNEDMENLIPSISIINEMSETEKLSEYHIILKNFIENLKCFDDYIVWINKEEKLFKLPVSKYEMLEQIKNFIFPFENLIRLCIRWLRYYYIWMDGPFEYLVPQFVESTVEEFMKEFLSIQKYYRNRIKQDMVGNPICKFKGQTEDPDPEKHPVPLKLCHKMIEWNKGFRLGVHIVNIMCNPALKPRHYDEMSEVVGFDITPDAGTTLRKMTKAGIEGKLDSLEIVSVGADKELQLQKSLVAMQSEWNTIDIPIGTYKDTNISILGNFDDIQAVLDDHIIKALTMRGSAFVKPCESEVRQWYDKLYRVNRTFEEWGKVQMSWLYLKPIFSSEDIVAQMPRENELYVQVDKIYRKYITNASQEPSLMQTAPVSGLLEEMESANVMLEEITSGVNQYLERKRLYFPRFFFLSNDEMLEILSETKNPLRVQPHLNKCFEGIYRLIFDDKLDIGAMISSEKETINFVTKVSTSEARGSVEKWLLQVEEQMLAAVQNEIALSFDDYKTTARPKWILKWPQMVVLCISQVYWALDVHDCLIGKNGLKEFFKKIQTDLTDIVALIRSKDLSNLSRNTIKSLIVIDVHAKDVVEDLVNKDVSSLDDFTWLAQLRYYYEDSVTLVRIINATVKFANEYLGNSERLVITPLTDRCYRTLIGAFQLHLNGAPEGPAGTGKTETTKDLAKALAVQCKVFNCSDGLDYIAMGKFFKGLASTGAWACFDEFNRIELEVLSVVAQQILCIMSAVKAGMEEFSFEGTTLSLNPSCYICITMNPGYAGRSELPDNLKVLFRTVAMMVPDYAMIGEISLYSYGFTAARSLAVKIVTTYRLCSEQLSTQNHYDYGMRAVKTVLVACGKNKADFPDEPEDSLLLRSIMDVNLPKFLSFDIPLFRGIISDLFPGVSLMKTDYTQMEQMFRETCKELNLQPVDCFFEKIVQTFEMMIVRHGFMMVGLPYAGKSTTLKVLSIILSKIKETTNSPYYQDCDIEILNPKAITMAQLYGAFDPLSLEWVDGVASTMFRNFVVDESSNRKWLIFDGPIDAVWIENMNTVLDDNKKLCLTSGEIITMNSKMSMIFEVMDLAQASPATVSRCGMIFMEPISLGWKVFARSWLNLCNPSWVADADKIIMDLLEWVIPPCISFIKRSCTQLIKPGEFNLLTTTLSMFQMLMDDAIEENADDFAKFLFNWYQAAIIMSVVWGLGGLLDINSRESFDAFYREIWSLNSPDYPPPPSCKAKLDITIPLEGLFCEYVYIFKQKGAWKYWPDLIRRNEPEVSALGIQVPTIDTGRYNYLLEMHTKHKKKMLLVGPTGTGKSFCTQNLLMNTLDAELYAPAFMTFTVSISATQTQDLLISKLQKFKRGKYGPPKGKTCVIFVDDMNMPKKEIYGAQPPIELLRQYFDHKYLFDKDTSKLNLYDLLIHVACGIPGGSRQDVYSRFTSHFNCFSINEFTADTMLRIFSNVLLMGLKKVGHAMDVIGTVTQIVNATLYVFNSSCVNLKPTPEKSHYIFNVRDIARVCAGCSMLRKESVDNKKIFTKLWLHETLRVFYDKLVNETDRIWLMQTVGDCIRDYFKDKLDNLFDVISSEATPAQVRDAANNLLFGTYLDLDSEPGDRKYEEISHLDKLSEIAYTNLEEYNATHKTKMDIVLFSYALRHLNKICRIMSLPAGSALLIGMGGSGRQTLTTLAAKICQQHLFQPVITKNYDVKEWRDDIKKVLKESGGYGKDTILLIAENQIKNPVFLTDIDCLLNLGEVPNIWPIDERQEILELVRLAAQGGNRNIDISPLQVFSYFVNRCKQKLHIVLCFSSIGSSLRNKIRMYPSLVNCCTVVWYETWPDDALQMVASKYMESINVEDNMKESMVVLCQHFHVTAKEAYRKFYEETGRTVYLTSASFLGLIKSFISLINNKQTETMNAKMRYVCGLETLQRAAEAVAIMQRDLNEFQPKLKQMAENSKVMTAEIEHNTIEASLATEQVKRDEVVANAQAAEAQAMEDECSKDLAQAVPVLEEAVQALNTLKNSDITLVKSMKNPPFAVKLVMAAVCVMKGVPPDRINDPATGKKVVDYWGPSKKILGDMAFLQSLKDYDKDDISPEIIAKIRKDFIPNKDFTPSVVAKASSAAEGLCKWIIALDLYEAVAKVVAPKKAKLNAAKQILTETKKILAEKRQLASELEANVTKLNLDLAAANAEKQRLEDEVELCTNKLRRAESLISGLGGERSRWSRAAEHLQSIYDSLPGDTLISSGIIAYLAPVSLSIREVCVADWLSLCKKLKISCSDNFGLMAVLGLDHQIQNWHVAGLPRDPFSIENAIIMNNSNRYSLFIDPQDQANKWIKNMEKPNRLNIIKFTQSDYMKVIVSALEVGRPVLLEGIGNELEPPLDPLLSRNTFVYSGVEYISLNDNVIPISKNFRFYMTSNSRNPSFEPETFTKVTIINFSLTQQGLNDQLLTTVVAKERPDLQQLLEEVIAENAKNKTKLKEVEDDILYTMSNSKKDILEDESSIKILDDSKVISADIITKQITSQKTLAQIEEFRQHYKTFAAHSSMLYTSITDLPNVDPMYQFSLYWYINLYKYSIENAKRSVDQKQRIIFLTEAITKNLYSAICRSIFEKDKLMYSFILCTKIMISEGRLLTNLLMLLLSGGDAVDSSKSKPNPSPDWITDKIWDNILKLNNLDNFNGFTDSFIANVSQWKAFYDSLDPVIASLPAPWEKTLNSFEKLVILNTIRPDKTADGIKMFVSKEMGTEFVTPPQFDISRSFQDATCLTPLIFVLSPGADPMNSLLIFAEKMGYIKTFQSISLGQGQGPIAQKLIEDAQDKGSWVCLQNCHLAVSWMPTLQMLWENMDFNNTTLSFRLWLTCYPTQDFPTPILQNGVKMTNEPPKGLQQNMLRTYMSEPMKNADFYNGCPGKDNAFARLLFGISFFHAVVQERRKYGSIGWNISYEFNDSDFQISVMQLQTFLNQYEKIPYAAICYLTGECNYGGRVTDVWDRRLIVDLLADYINADVVKNLTYEFAGQEKFVLWRKLEHPELVKYIHGVIPNNPSPEVFGLHPNACITQELNTSQKLLSSMLMIQGKGSDTSAESSNSKLLAMVLDMLKRLPPNFDIELSEQKYPFNYNESMNTVLTQEMNRFNRLLSIIRKSCSDLEKAIKGILPITPELEILGSSLEFNKIPDVWMKASYPSIKPVASYIQDFLRRLHWLDDWYQNGKGSTFWLAGFYFTQAFLTGVVQNYARKYKIPIDTLTFDFNVLQSDKMDTNPADGVYVNGIFIDGARWDKSRGVLAEQRPKVLIEGMPTIHLIPIKILNLPNDSRYKCPLYKTTERRGILSTTGHSTNFVLQMLLKTNEDASHWIKRSAALICQTND